LIPEVSSPIGGHSVLLLLPLLLSLPHEAEINILIGIYMVNKKIIQAVAGDTTHHTNCCQSVCDFTLPP
jgi:hypothetical protein